MNSRVKQFIENKKIVWCAKILCCLFTFMWLFSNLFINGIDYYVSYKDYSLINEIGDLTMCDGYLSIEQPFISSGNILSNVSLYFGELTNEELSISIENVDGTTLVQKTIVLNNYSANSWNVIPFECKDVKRDNQYILHIEGRDLSCLALTSNNSCPSYFTSCTVDGNESKYLLVFGVQITYKYLMLGYGLELIVDICFALFLAFLLCFSIIKFETLLEIFRKSEKKQGLVYALFFSVYTVLIFNPLEDARNKVTDFARVVGAGLNAGVDVSKRISNFSYWFICFAVLFVLFFLLANYFKTRELPSESNKARNLLDNVINVSLVNLCLRCVTYFYDESLESSVFYYSDYTLMLIIISLSAYIVLNLGERICLINMEAYMLCGWMLVFPASIVITHEWTLGRVFMGFQAIISLIVILTIKAIKLDWNSEKISGVGKITAVLFSFIPFCTSFYIEFINILNQHTKFLTQIRRYYFSAVVLGIIVTAIICFVTTKKNKKIRNWKAISYPVVILGFSCLWNQAAITATYGVDMFETANSSVLISDFLNFGNIPIVEHYGGHMMMGVWEGLIYAFINGDYQGAVLSPYWGYAAVVVAILFYILIKKIWNEDTALLITLFFPFYSSISYWGLGLLVSLTAMVYIRKNSYFRAILLWFAVVWCATYRLDLGFAFAVAVIIAMTIYAIADRNRQAFKQLSITLLGWGMFGVILWFVLCIAKGINPVDRLIEFLMINLSNQNWAYAGIGDMAQIKFAWAYLIIPFAMVVTMLYTIFSKKIRENLGKGVWVVTLTIGFSYFYNFSRGLVRHSLAEGTLSVCIWSAYLFLAIFGMAVLNKKEMLIPIFSGMLILNGLLLGTENFTSTCIADSAVTRVGDFTETWTLSRFAVEESVEGETVQTYWQKIKEDQEVIDRVVLDDDTIRTINSYKVVIDVLLDDDETFVDCINKTTLYSLIGRQNPAYISQSPLQLSGEFTQEKFVEEIDGVPIVLMPYDKNNDRASESLDGVPNSYRYYKVFEYIYQNYVPLCTYEDRYAVWCLMDRYDELSIKVNGLEKGVDVKEKLVLTEENNCYSVQLTQNADGSILISSTGPDPQVREIQNIMDLSDYIDTDMTISVEYETDKLGPMQIYYTTDDGEEYVTEKSITYNIENNNGTARFSIPVTKYTRIRLDIPEESNVKIKSFIIGAAECNLIDYGYDAPYMGEDGELYYLPYIHNYELDKLPLIWAEGDIEKSIDNEVITMLERESNVFRYDQESSDYGENGNYIKVHIDYAGVDLLGKTDTNDETTSAILKLGTWKDGEFTTLYYYTFTVEEGQHDYMFRVSSDYYWYVGNVNAVLIESESQLSNINMEILEAD